MSRIALVLCLCFGWTFAANAQEEEHRDDGLAKLKADVAAARDGLKDHPKFKKYYEHLAANPDTLPVNGPKLAALLATEAKTSAVPSLLATWQEVVRLASAGNDFKTAFPAIDSLQTHKSGLLTPAAARLAKGKLLAAVAEANAIKPVPGEREALLELVRPLLKESLAANDEAVLPSLLAADAKLSWTTTESANSIQLLLPLASQATDSSRPAVAKLLFDHLDALVPKTAVGKSRKDFADAIAAARAQQTLATKPLDPAANQAYGMHLLNRGQWRESLTYLALGTAAEWKKLAADSLELKTAAEIVVLADRWSALDEDKNAPSKEVARHFYQEALADKSLVGIPRAAAEEKAKALGEPRPKRAGGDLASTNKPLPLNKWTEFLPLVDCDQDLVRGFFAKGPRNSILMDASIVSKLRLPVLLADCSYDFAVEFTPGAEARDHLLVFPVGQQNVVLVVDGSGNKACYFMGLTKSPYVERNLVHANQACRYEIQVRLKEDRASVAFLLNDETILEHEGLLAANPEHKEYYLGTKIQPGLAGYESTAAFTSCKVRPLSGQPQLGRDVPLIKPIPESVMKLKATSLTTLKPLQTNFTNSWHGVNKLSNEFDKAPIVGGVPCREYLYAHAPSSMTYAISPKTKYFTAIAYCAYSSDAKFIIKVDGQEMYSVSQRPISTVVVEIPNGAKELQLICDPLGSNSFDQCFWCFPAYR